MNNNDLNKDIMNILNKMDKRTLQENLNKALDVLKTANTDELAKQINSTLGKNQESPELQNLDPNIVKNLNNLDISKALNYIGSHGNDIKEKLKNIIK